MDFRFAKVIDDYLIRQDYMGKSDIISIAGSSRDFITPVDENDGRYAWKQLDLSIKLHDPEEILIIDHQDCGGYAQDNTIPKGITEDEDKNLHHEFMKKIVDKIKSVYPTKKVVLVYANLAGRVEVIK